MRGARTGGGSSWSAAAPRPGRGTSCWWSGWRPRSRSGRLLTRQHQSLERQAHATLISAILAQADADPDEAAVRARALGIPVAGRLLVTAVLRFRLGGPGLPAQARVLEVAEAMADACRSERIPALVGPLDDVRAGALLSLERQADPDQALTAVCDGARQRLAHRTRMPAAPARHRTIR